MKQFESFSHFGLNESLVTNLSSLGYERPTPIQVQSVPLMLEGKDIIAQSKTGSGKTAAFGLSILHNLNAEHYAVQALILCPTRELADQVCQALRKLARSLQNIKILNLSGGVPLGPQLESLRHGSHIIVGTPGRILKHLDKRSLNLRYLKTLVLDEADRMLDMGFFDEIENIINLCPQERQTLLFSATFPNEIKRIASDFMNNPTKIVIEKNENDVVDIEQIYFEVGNLNDKYSVLHSVISHYNPQSALIFCNTKDQTMRLVDWLKDEGFSACVINGDMEQRDRDLAMILFSNQSCTFLVATDVAARGLDIKELPAVINFDLTKDPDVHTHRIGRTGRAGCKGLAINLIGPKDFQNSRDCHYGVEGKIENLSSNQTVTRQPEMVTFCINVGKKDKIRPGDILGALIKDAGMSLESIGKINIVQFHSFVAIQRAQKEVAFKYLEAGKIKNKKIKAFMMKENFSSFAQV